MFRFIPTCVGYDLRVCQLHKVRDLCHCLPDCLLLSQRQENNPRTASVTLVSKVFLQTYRARFPGLPGADKRMKQAKGETTHAAQSRREPPLFFAGTWQRILYDITVLKKRAMNLHYVMLVRGSPGNRSQTFCFLLSITVCREGKMVSCAYTA